MVSISQSPKRVPSASTGRSWMLVRHAMLVALVTGRTRVRLLYLRRCGRWPASRPDAPPCAARRPLERETTPRPLSYAPHATTAGSPCRGPPVNRGGGARNGTAHGSAESTGKCKVVIDWRRGIAPVCGNQGFPQASRCPHAPPAGCNGAAENIVWRGARHCMPGEERPYAMAPPATRRTESKPARGRGGVTGSRPRVAHPADYA